MVDRYNIKNINLYVLLCKKNSLFKRVNSLYESLIEIKIQCKIMEKQRGGKYE